MRVALLLNGFVRDLNNLNVVKKFLELNKDFDIDIYTTTYGVVGIPSKFDAKSKDIYDKSNVITEEFLRSKLPFKKIVIEDSEIAQKYCLIFAAQNRNLHDSRIDDNEFYIANMFSQWRNLYKTYSLIDNPSEYDLIIRYRYDLNGANLNLSEYSNLKTDEVYLRNKGKKFYYKDGAVGPLCFDGCVIGTPEAMKTVCTVGTYKNYGLVMNDPKNVLVKKNNDFFVTQGKNSYYSNENNLIFWCLKNNLKIKNIKEQHLPGSTLTRPHSAKRV